MFEVEEFCDVSIESEVFAFLERSTGTQLVEDVVVALGLGLIDESRAFQEIGADSRADDFRLAVKQDL